jgi:hypothetical protein
MPHTAHLDTFARDNLPPRSQWPQLIFGRPELQYPERLNCAAELLDRMVAAGHGERPALWAPVDGRPVHCTYRTAARPRQPHRPRSSRTWAWCRATACCCAGRTTR